MRLGTSAMVLMALAACSAGNERSSDSAYAQVQQRGAKVMGVDQYTSQHVFEPLPDGGRIVLQREQEDSAGTAVIREHMWIIAQGFSAGDFTLPGDVHAMTDVPGTQQMRELRNEITYTAQDLPRGGELVISTTNPKAVAAIHDFLAFQRREHRAGAHMK